MAEAKYTWGDIIIDPTSDRAKEAVGKQVYYSQFSNVCLLRANNDDRVLQGILISIDPKNSLGSFIVDGSPYACIIVKKEESKPKYVPFKSKKEFLERYLEVKDKLGSDSFEGSLLQCGMWLKIEGIGSDGYSMITEIWGDGVVLGYSKLCTMQNVSGGYTTVSETTSWEDLYEGFNFLDGSPCGRLTESQ